MMKQSLINRHYQAELGNEQRQSEDVEILAVLPCACEFKRVFHEEWQL